MMRPNLLLALFLLTGCAATGAESVQTEGATDDVASALTTPTISIPRGMIEPEPRLPAPYAELPAPVLIPSAPPWATTCGKGIYRFAVLTRKCAPLATEGGSWSARAVFTSEEDTLCDMRWQPRTFGMPAGSVTLAPSRAAYAALERIAAPEVLALTFPRPPSIRALCAAVVVCNPAVTSCPARDEAPPGRLIRPIGGMGGCSSCAFVTGDTLYAVLPVDYSSGLVEIDLGAESIHVAPEGAQTFMVDLSRRSGASRASGFARVYRY